MKARQEALDDGTRLELERAEAREHRGIEELPLAAAPGCGHRYIPLFGTGTVSISRSIIVSGVMRSDSA